jgi:hypothetical protein
VTRNCYLSPDKVSDLNDIWFAAKSPSVRVVQHSAGFFFFNLGENLFAAKRSSGSVVDHSTELLT